MKIFLLSAAFCLIPNIASLLDNAAPLQQNNGKIQWQNPSFEDKPGASVSPKGWSSNTPGSTPDILPGAWGLQIKAQHGKTCLGLVTREDGTVEDVGQALPAALRKDSCYYFTMYLSHAYKYVGFNQPLRLRIWGGSAPGSRQVLLDASPLIDHEDWRMYEFQFTPTRDVQYITFEAHFAPGVTLKYKGNILLDNCSPIERCDRA